MPDYCFTGLLARQSVSHSVVSFAATASEIASIASIDQVSRNAAGKLLGFQRPQIASHINEIRDYLRQEDAVLPNPIVLAFTDKVSIVKSSNGTVQVTVHVDDSPPGFVVDGQQRLTALLGAERPDFEVFVSALICESNEELRKQFVLINNSRPLPKSLIYELLPTIPGLPPRLSARTFAADLTQRLNFDPSSTLLGQIQQHTNPSGVIRDTAIQRVIMNSSSDGAIRELMHFPNKEEDCFQLLSNFYGSVQRTFPEAWHGHKPRTSRLVHGAGIVAMGYVMEVLYSRNGARTEADFLEGMQCLQDVAAWTRGSWRYGDDNLRPWNAIQNVNRDVLQLTDFLVRTVRRSARGISKPDLRAVS